MLLRIEDKGKCVYERLLCTHLASSNHFDYTLFATFIYNISNSKWPRRPIAKNIIRKNREKNETWNNYVASTALGIRLFCFVFSFSSFSHRLSFSWQTLFPNGPSKWYSILLLLVSIVPTQFRTNEENEKE